MTQPPSDTDASGRAHVLSASRVLAAPAARVYAVLADYRDGHPAILPRPPFVGLDVEEGGRGEGTVIRVEMSVLGRRQQFRARVSEPEPGRTLVETNDTGYTTTFTVEPEAGGGCRVTITTDTERGGVFAALERWMVARLLRTAYAKELELLEGVARGAASAPAP